MPKAEKLHLHLESFKKRPALFHLTEERWAAAARRHRDLAKKLRVTIGWDGDIIDDALKTADVMINSSPPKQGLRERAPRLKWIQTTGAGVDALTPFDWLPQDVALTNNSGAHGAKVSAWRAMGSASERAASESRSISFEPQKPPRTPSLVCSNP